MKESKKDWSRRAGKNFSRERKDILNKAKKELRKAFS